MKESKQPLLSVCIPTYNRRYSLQHTLKSIIDQDEFKSGDVEIVISDNVSTDETEIEVGKLCDKYSNIRYFRNKENIGGVPNVNKVISLGEGDYLWWLGSDSLILEGGLKKTLEIIQKKSPDIVYNTNEENYKHLNTNYDNELGINYFDTLKEFSLFLGNQYIYDKNSFMQMECLLTYISSICLSKKFYRESLNNIIVNYGEEYFNNYTFSQELICFYGNIKGGICIIKKHYLDRYKYGKRNTYLVNRRIINDFKKLSRLIGHKCEINDKNFKKFIHKSLYFWYKHYLIGKIIKLLIRCNLYRSVLYLYRKLRNINNAEYIEEIDQSI